MTIVAVDSRAVVAVVRGDGATVIVVARAGAHTTSVGFGPYRGTGCWFVAVGFGFRLVAPVVVCGRITTVAVMVTVGVVHRVHRGRHSRTMTRRRHRRKEAVIVVAVGARTVVVAYARSDVNHHPRLGARAMPAEADGLEVLESGEAIEFATYCVVGHDCVSEVTIDTVGRNFDCDSLDAAGTYLDVFLSIAVSVVRIEVDADVPSVGVVANILHVIVDRDRVVVVHHHGL